MQSCKVFTQQREHPSVVFRASYDSPENRRALAQLMGQCQGSPGMGYKDSIGLKSDQLWALLCESHNRALTKLADRCGLLGGDECPRSTLQAWAQFLDAS